MKIPGRRIASLTALALLSASMVGAEFCEDLEKVAASSADGFEDVRGDLVSDIVGPLSDTRVVWQCTLAFAGVRTCEVVWHQQAFTFNTFWHKTDEPTNDATFAALSELLEGCGLRRQQVSRSGRSQSFVHHEIDNLEIVLARNTRRVRLSLTAAGFPNP